MGNAQPRVQDKSMRYSLLSRFRGTLLGARLGEIYGYGDKERASVSLSPVKLNIEPGESVGLNAHICPWSQIAVMCAQSLIREGRIDLEVQSGLASKIKAANCSQVAIATLPVALFFHENQATLQQQLRLASATWQGAASTEPALAVGYALAQALTEKLNPATLIPQTLTYLQDSQTPLVQHLAQVQTLLEQGASLEIALTHLLRDRQLSTNPIALAFYCFLSTPEDFRLSVTRAIRTGYQPQITAALTGALSGVYNSFTGIPLGWRIAFNRTDNGEILQLAACLLAAWSGVYDATTADRTDQMAVAAPRVIKPRQVDFRSPG